MQPRDIFDGLLVALLSVGLYVEVIGLTISTDRVNAVVTAVQNIETAMLLALGAAVGVVFLAFITIYVPRKQRTTRPEDSS